MTVIECTISPCKLYPRGPRDRNVGRREVRARCREGTMQTDFFI